MKTSSNGLQSLEGLKNVWSYGACFYLMLFGLHQAWGREIGASAGDTTECFLFVVGT